MSRREEIRRQILSLVREYVDAEEPRAWKPGDKVPYAGRVVGAEERANLVEASLACWLTLGEYGDRFEKKLKAAPATRSSSTPARPRISSPSRRSAPTCSRTRCVRATR